MGAAGSEGAGYACFPVIEVFSTKRNVMKALVKSKAAEGIWLEDVPEPSYGIDDVQIKVLKTGICGTDVHIYNWDAWAQKTIKTGTVTGHEFVGRIVAVGSNVQSHKVGDLVSAEGHIVCGHCRNCLAGRRHLCANTLGVGVNRNGAFAEKVVVPAMNIWHCDAKIPIEHVCDLRSAGATPRTPRCRSIWWARTC